MTTSRPNRNNRNAPLPRIDLAAIRQQYLISDVALRVCTGELAPKLRGREWVSLCPFHKERTPSFTINDDKGYYHCFGCGAHGDVLDFVMHTQGVHLPDAARIIAGHLVAHDPAERREASRKADALDAAKRYDARKMWHDAQRAEGTLVQAYLANRGITLPPPPSLRHGRVWAWKDYEAEPPRHGPAIDAMLCAAQRADGRITGVQRVFLTPDGRKHGMDAPKRSLGDVRGSALRFGPVAPHIILAEGPEDGATLWQRFIDEPATSVWAVFGTGNMPQVEWPAEVERVTIAGQNNYAGRMAAERAVLAVQASGRAVRVIYPDLRYDDWNDELLGKERADV